MERLTKTYSDGTHGASDSLPCGENSYGYKNLLIEKLGKYEDLEEQDRLVKLPCRIGDIVYAIPSKRNYRLNELFGAKDLNAVCRQVVDHIEFNSYGYLVSTNKGMTVHKQEEFGETWFLTKSKAEQRLKEMESYI